MPYLLFLFIVVPFVEFMLLIEVGKNIGTLNTVMLVIGTGFVGASLARMEGLTTLRKIQTSVAQGQIPGRELINGLMILVGAAFLVTPGIITDILGLCMILPGTRSILREVLIFFLKKKISLQINHVLNQQDIHIYRETSNVSNDPNIIDGEVISSKER